MRRLTLLLLCAAFAHGQEEEEGAAGEEDAKEGGLDALGGRRWKAKPIDFSKVDRTIRKAPELKSPMYGLFLFGTEGERRVWAVIDGGTLYLDRNADGDLTAEDERIVQDRPDDLLPTFTVGDFKEPGTDVVHTGFVIKWTTLAIEYRMKWAGESVIAGSCAFAIFPKSAPVLVPGTERPFDFAWAGETLKRGKENDVRVRIGNRGDRDAAFSWVDEKFLPEGEKVLIQLVCKDAKGTERKLTADLKERASGGIYRGPVKIPKDAASGTAILRVRLPDSSAYESFVSEIPVTIE